MKPTENNNSRNKQLYAQTLSTNIKEIFKIKDLFSKLSSKKIKEIRKTINEPRKKKLHINMTTKGPSKRQVIIPMGNDNISKFISSSGEHIANINRELKNIKLDVLADFVCTDYHRLIITTNKVTTMSNLSIIERYIKNVNNVKQNKISTPHLFQSKSYLKITSISYLMENTNTPINSNMVEIIIKNSHIFDNVILTSKPRVIKILPKSDMIIIQVDIWDIQSSNKAKCLINRYFNFHYHHQRSKYESRHILVQKLLEMGLYHLYMLSTRFKIYKVQ